MTALKKKIEKSCSKILNRNAAVVPLHRQSGMTSDLWLFATTIFNFQLSTFNLNSYLCGHKDYEKYD